MRICFFGSDEFSLPTLKSLHESEHELVAVVTQPDRPQGRGLKVKPNTIALYAASMKTPLYQPEKLKDEAFCNLLESLRLDVAVVCAYGRILHRRILDIPFYGCINIHPSLLPKYRGAIPIEAALMAGDEKTGISIIYMDEGCDTGDIIVQYEYPIDPEDNGGSLREKLSRFAPEILKIALKYISEGKVPRTKQVCEKGFVTHPINKEDTFILWEFPAEKVRNLTRALWPQPAAKALFRGKLIKIGPVKVLEQEEKNKALPGTIVEIRKYEGPVITTSHGLVLLCEVKPEGKNLMNAWQFTQGYSPQVGEVFTRP